MPATSPYLSRHSPALECSWTCCRSLAPLSQRRYLELLVRGKDMLLHQFSGAGCQIVWDLTNINVELMLLEKPIMRKRNMLKPNLWAPVV